MPTITHRISALCTAAVLALGALASVSPVATVAAVDAAWVAPSVPAKCTTAQMNAGTVAGCTIRLDSGLPESRDWPTPPYPDPAPGAVIAWVDLANGASGPVVVRVQQALVANGATIAADGQFGPITAGAVAAYQTTKGLAATGIVNEATATALGVQNTGPASFPPVGWTWLGWGYNASQALYQWEQQIVGNENPIGTVKAKQLKSFPEALPLFEGFVAEIQAKGYVIGDAGMYVFRCTASTRKDCAGLSRTSLSNHSYGLALDINTAKNPMKTYYGSNGASACLTPVVTDVPQWVVQVAETWGLYWGGYGWSSGCSSPSQVKSSASRDPMHFEFNGTVAQAKAILAYRVSGVTPTPVGPTPNPVAATPPRTGNCLDVADAAGTISTKCFGLTEVPPANTRLVITTKPPVGATSAMVNITTTGATNGGYITAESCGAVATTARQWSNGNVRPGRPVASTAIVPIDSDGRFCLYQSTAMHTIVDVQGYFTPAGSSGGTGNYTPISPVRSTDTRTRPICRPDAGCEGLGPVPAGTEVRNTTAAPGGAIATVANITAVGGAGTGYVTADACGTLIPGPQTRSTLNFAGGDTVANLAVVPSDVVDGGGVFCTYSPNGLHEIIDVQGYFGMSSKESLKFVPQTPVRLVDSRGCWTDPVTLVERCGKRNAAGSIMRITAPAGASVAVVNLTAIDPQAAGYVSADACSNMTAGPQPQSNLNAIVGAVVANMAMVPVADDGTFCVYVSTSMHVAVDVMGTFASTGQLDYVPVTPLRVHDSRQPK
ncbi:MAG TPA: peptidoglycan-binding protein [Ilumatobacteraceae bacterium]|nr:peptidoglycan-binding protein [Ilumatobacteraceae bacterium]